MDNILKLNLLLAYKNKGKNDLADMLGVSTAATTRWFNGSRSFPVDRLDEICNKLEVTRDFFDNIGSLITSKPAPITSEVTPVDFGDKIHNVIELQEGALAAHFISLDDAARHRAAVPAYMPGLPLSSDPYYSLRVKGDSMTPILNNGDWLFAALLPPEEAHTPNAQTAYVIALDGVFLVKWLRFHAPDANYSHGSYEFVSANAAYPPYREPAERINAVLRVVAALKPL